MMQKLDRLRKTKIALARMKNELAMMQPASRSVRMDGMPHVGSLGGLDALIDARDRLQARIDQAQEEACALEKSVTPFLQLLPHELYTFCVCYYIAALPPGEVCRITARTRATFYRYKRAVADSARAYATGRENENDMIQNETQMIP